MKKLGLIFILVLNITNPFVFAQNPLFVYSGNIEYEKRINMHARIKERIGQDASASEKQAFENYERTQPKFEIVKSNLLFTKSKTFFEPEVKDLNVNASYFGEDPLANQLNIVYADQSSKGVTVQKTVLNETILLRDSPAKIIWKFVDETREIAGYNCRRANGLIMDSIYIVAFYAEEIRVSGGPESFSGLPGMILGVALPHEHITWFATMVTPKPIDTVAIKEPVKGRVMSRNEFKNFLTYRFKGNPKEDHLLKGFAF